jgi:hypothetical protein
VPPHVKLGALVLDAHERRLKLMAAAGYISPNVSAPLVEPADGCAHADGR